MVQTLIVVLLILGDAVLVYFNLPALQSQITLTAPGTQATMSHLVLMAAVAGSFVLVWLAGVADRAALERRLRQRNAALHAMGEEMLLMKSAAYDQERPPLADIRMRLDSMERDLRALRTRVVDEAAMTDGMSRKDREQAKVTAGIPPL